MILIKLILFSNAFFVLESWFCIKNRHIKSEYYDLIFFILLIINSLHQQSKRK